MWSRRKKRQEPVDDAARTVAWREFDREQEREALRGLGPGFGRVPQFGKRREKS
jgi:hypothetical protein